MISVSEILNGNLKMFKKYAYRLYFWHLHRNADTEPVSVGGMNAQFYNPEQSQEIFKRARDEEPIFADLNENINQDDIFYDIGAQYGVFTCLAGNQLESGQVFAFEPMPGPYHRLRYNVSLNEVSGSVYKYALTDHNSAGTGWLDESDSDISLMPGDKLRERKSLPAPDVVKIDVEGGELKALKGLSRTFEDPTCRVIYCEIHPKGCFDMEGYENIGLTEVEVDELYKTLDDWGFETETIHERGEQSFVRAER